jgi:hypothetical protein
MRRNYGLMDTNTAVTKDVILFKYENPKHYKLLNIFALVQFGFWSYLSHFAFTCLKDAPPMKEDPSTQISWWRKINLGDQKYRNTITFCSFFIGIVKYQSYILILFYFLESRCIKFEFRVVLILF